MMDQIFLTDQKWKLHISKEMPEFPVEFEDSICLPSTVQQQKKTPVTSERSDSYLTDPHAFEGYAVYERTVDVGSDKRDRDIFFVMERTRMTKLWINGSFVGAQNSLCTAHKYDITKYYDGNPMRITVMVDNISCPVHDGHMSSPNTQTNWLGVTGQIYIACRSKQRLDNIQLYPDVDKKTVTVTGNVIGGKITVTAQVKGFPEKTVTLTESFGSFVYEMPDAELWSEHNPICYEMQISCNDDISRIPFGMRKFTAKGMELFINNQKIFLRGKHDALLFPLTGAAPTDLESWKKVLSTAKEYGINHYRFHTCCPPEAAFYAADELGIYLEPELPFWGIVPEKMNNWMQYLVDEGYRILDSFGNHPSFFGFSMGNELWGSKTLLNQILGEYKDHDPRHLYTQGSSNFQHAPEILSNEDFFVGVRCSKTRLFRGSFGMCDAPLGHLQTKAPESCYTYDEVICPAVSEEEAEQVGLIEIQHEFGVKKVTAEAGDGQLIPRIPVVSHEVGQYFMYPDYCEISKYTGVLKPYNLEIFRERLKKAGLLHLADQYFRASGRFAADCYKFEIETALRTRVLSGFQLLDLQDFTGQGTALVGILNAFMENKGIISAKQWRQFCNDKVILGALSGFVFSAEQKQPLALKLYHYGKDPEVDPQVQITLTVDNKVCFRTALKTQGIFRGGVFDLGSVMLEFPAVSRPCKAVLKIVCADVDNQYDLWIFPEQGWHQPETAVVTQQWQQTCDALEKGKTVLYFPCNLDDTNSIEGTYCTDFWNYPMFSGISKKIGKPLPVGTLGLLIDHLHSALKDFPSEPYSTAQWYDIVECSRSLIVDGKEIKSIVRTIDNCQRNHDLSVMFEAKAGNGKLLVCTAQLLQSRSICCQALWNSLLAYIQSKEFDPVQTVSLAKLQQLFER